MFRLNRWIAVGLLMVLPTFIWAAYFLFSPKGPASRLSANEWIALGVLIVGVLTVTSGIYFNIRKDRREERESMLRIAKEEEDVRARETEAAASADAVRADEIRMEKLRELLLNPPPGQKWRTMETLSRSIAADEQETTRLLKAIGARRSLAERNVWTLLA
jgi:hypothetical protein